jgi:hypothetical protein
MQPYAAVPTRRYTFIGTILMQSLQFCSHQGPDLGAGDSAQEEKGPGEVP